MDQRAEPRRRLRLEVELAHEENYLGRFRTRDVCTRGAFVETGPVGLRARDVVTMTFVGEPRQRRCLHGEVVRRDPEGIGLRYASRDLALDEPRSPGDVVLDPAVASSTRA